MVTEFFQIKFTNFFIPNFCIVFFCEFDSSFSAYATEETASQEHINLSDSHTADVHVRGRRQQQRLRIRLPRLDRHQKPGQPDGHRRH